MPPETGKDALYLRHMLECIERIEEYADGNECSFKGARLGQNLQRTGAPRPK